MHPDLFSLGPFTVHTWGFLLAVACGAVGIGAGSLLKRQEYPSGLILDLLLVTVISGIVGSRIGYVLVYRWSEFIASPLYLFQFDGTGLMWYGGFIGGFIGFWITLKIKELNFWNVADSIVPYLALGYAIVRVGCFLNSCCYGKPTDSMIGFVFTNIDTVTRWPTQLLSSGINVLFFAGLLFLWNNRSFIGQVASAYLISYSLYRFGIEFLRDSAVHYGPFSPGQVISIVIFIIGIISYIYCYRKDRKRIFGKRINKFFY